MTLQHCYYFLITFRGISEREEKLKQEEAKRKEIEEEQSSLSVTSACKAKMFHESMTPAELGDWLFDDLGRDFADDIDELKST